MIKKTWYNLAKYILLYFITQSVIFLAVLVSLIGHIARYTPSSGKLKHLKNINRKSYQFIFYHHLAFAITLYCP